MQHGVRGHWATSLGVAITTIGLIHGLRRWPLAMGVTRSPAGATVTNSRPNGLIRPYLQPSTTTRVLY